MFCTVDKRQDVTKFAYEKITIPSKNWIDIQDHVNVKGANYRGILREGMASLASRIIDESYSEMKMQFPKERHDYWEEQPLSDINLEYAARDAYVTYQLYVKIWYFLRYLVFCPGCKKEDELRGRLCNQCRSAEIDADRARDDAAAEIARLEAELSSVQAELASVQAELDCLNAPASSDNTQQASPPHGKRLKSDEQKSSGSGWYTGPGKQSDDPWQKLSGDQQSKQSDDPWQKLSGDQQSRKNWDW